MGEEIKKLEEEIIEKADELVVLIGKASEMGCDVYLNEAFFPSLEFDKAITGSDLFIIIERENSTREIGEKTDIKNRG